MNKTEYKIQKALGVLSYWRVKVRYVIKIEGGKKLQHLYTHVYEVGAKCDTIELLLNDLIALHGENAHIDIISKTVTEINNVDSYYLTGASKFNED